jgi:hypothetical protein
MAIRREDKFGYGFLLVGLFMPYLLDKFFGPLAGLLVALCGTILGIAFIASGHLGKEEHTSGRSKAAVIILASAAVLTILGFGWKVYRRPKEEMSSKSSQPIQPITPQNQQSSPPPVKPLQNPPKRPISQPLKPKLRITSVAMSAISSDNKMTTEVDFISDSKDTIAVLGAHAFILLPVPPSRGPADFSPESEEAEKEFIAAEESAWSQFETANHKFDPNLAFDNPPLRPEHMTQAVDLSSHFSLDQIQAIREGRATLFMVGELSYMAGKDEVDVPYCLSLLDDQGHTIYCSHHN